MKTNPSFLALDLGAETGRLMMGELTHEKIALSEIYRFVNSPVRLPGGLHWDVLHLWQEIKTGLKIASQQAGKEWLGIGVDTWGVDFALLDSSGNLLSNPYHYRDGRTDGMLDEVFKLVPRETIFTTTGNQFIQINTLFQLFSMVKNNSPILNQARQLLMMPDLFNYWLSGQMVSEFTIATTSQCFDPHQNNWATKLMTDLGIPQHIFPSVIQPGFILGPIRKELCAEVGIQSTLSVIAPGSHDTASAFAAVPSSEGSFAGISSGTWSIVGTETSQPVITPKTLKYNFTNEGSVSGRWCLSQNIMGLWLVQECKRSWERQGVLTSYEELTKLASEAVPFKAVIDPDAAKFLKPGDMPERILNYCRRRHQPVPETKGEMIRIILESIALKYRWTIEKLEEILEKRLEVIYMIGGGTQNHLLCQLTADACQRECITGPVEATAIGNILVQAVGLKLINSISEGRSIVGKSFLQTIYQPKDDPRWDSAYKKILVELGEKHD